MNIRGTTISCLLAAAALLTPRFAAAQRIPPIVERDKTWKSLSDAFLVAGASSVFLTPRFYFDSKERPSPSWHGAWHISSITPAVAMVGLTLLVEFPIKDELESPRPGCSVAQTLVRANARNCATFGGPSTHAFASWGATGAGLGIFLVDTLKYSDGKVSAPAFLGQVAIPFAASILVSVGRGVDLNNDTYTEGIPNPITLQPFESRGQILAGALHGFLGGLTVGVAYAMLRPPSCGSANAVFCW